MTKFSLISLLDSTAGEIPASASVSSNNGQSLYTVGKMKPENDLRLLWLTTNNPEMEVWRDLGHRWISHVVQDARENDAALEPEQRAQKLGNTLVNLATARVRMLRAFFVDYLGRCNMSNEYLHKVWRSDPSALLHKNAGADQDNFWEVCCVRTVSKGGIFERGSTMSLHLTDFLTWTIRVLHPFVHGAGFTGNDIEDTLHPDYRNPFRARNKYGTPIELSGVSNATNGDLLNKVQLSPDGHYNLYVPGTAVPSNNDPRLTWLTAEFPEMQAWRDIGYRWISRVVHDAENAYAAMKSDKRPRNVSKVTANHTITRVRVLRTFFIDYLGRRDSSGEYLHPKWRRDPSALLHINSGADPDDFWEVCCVGTASKSGKMDRGSTMSKYLADFLTWSIQVLHFSAPATTVLDKERRETLNQDYRNPFRARNGSGLVLDRGVARGQDLELRWVLDEFPELAKWQPLAKEWTQNAKRNLTGRLSSLSKFIGNYLAAGARDGMRLAPDVACDPARFLDANSVVRDNLREVFADTAVSQHDSIIEFIDWILLHHYSEPDGHGGHVQATGFRNPFTKMDRVNRTDHRVSVRTALPYGYLERLRAILVQGPCFKDWMWAQQAHHHEKGYGTDWFEVPIEQINLDDPDCVWRDRATGKNRPSTHRKFVEMWSPVRWVALLFKLALPLRGMQVRVLDSGESDTYHFDYSRMINAEQSPWILNDRMNHDLRRHVDLAGEVAKTASRRSTKEKNKLKKEYSNGVFRRTVELISENLNEKPRFSSVESTQFYINTNKTADSELEGAAKGYEIPWPISQYPLDANGLTPIFVTAHDERRWLSLLSQNLHYWLAKLRDWQSNYNPVVSRTPWSELAVNGIIDAKSLEQLAMYRPATFLFREPARIRNTEGAFAHLPITSGMLSIAWWQLLKTLQGRLAAEGHTNKDGTTLQLVADDTGQSKAMLFDLHSLRVSLITALVVDGKVDVSIVQKIVGHSRLLMTLYYNKPNIVQSMQAIEEGFDKLEASRVESEAAFLMSASVEEIRKRMAFKNAESALEAIGTNVNERNPAGWLELAAGFCPVGGNTTPGIEGKGLPGCFNGGELVRSDSNPSGRRYAPVSGGARNCPNCRWFITGPSFLPALVAKFNNTAYHLAEARSVALREQTELDKVLDDIYDLEAARAMPHEMAGLRKFRGELERRVEGSSKKVLDLAETLANLFRLIERCKEVLRLRNFENQDETALVLNGGAEEWGTILSETNSELMQLCAVSDDAEIYPELDPGKAIVRRSQLLDYKLMKDGLSSVFMTLSEEDQKLIGNEIIRRLAVLCNPDDAALGRIKAVRLIESDVSLADGLGMKHEQMQKLIASCRTGSRRIPIIAAGFGAIQLIEKQKENE